MRGRPRPRGPRRRRHPRRRDDRMPLRQHRSPLRRRPGPWRAHLRLRLPRRPRRHLGLALRPRRRVRSRLPHRRHRTHRHRRNQRTPRHPSRCRARRCGVGSARSSAEWQRPAASTRPIAPTQVVAVRESTRFPGLEASAHALAAPISMFIPHAFCGRAVTEAEIASTPRSTLWPWRRCSQLGDRLMKHRAGFRPRARTNGRTSGPSARSSPPKSTS